MKLDTIDLAILEQYGFTLVTEQYKEDEGIDNLHALYPYIGSWFKDLGYSLNGTRHYYVIGRKGKLMIVTSPFNGEGCDIELDNTLVELMQAGLIELPLKKGDIMMITGDSNEHEFEIGELVTLKYIECTDRQIWACDSDNDHAFVKSSDMKRFIPTPVTYKLGDKVEIIGVNVTNETPHPFEMGQLLELLSHDPLDKDGYIWGVKDSEGEEWWLQEGEFKLANHE